MFNCALFHGPTCFSCAGASLSAHSETINQFAKQLNSTLHVHVCGELATRKNFHRATADTFLSSSRQFTFLSAAASWLLSLFSASSQNRPLFTFDWNLSLFTSTLSHINSLPLYIDFSWGHNIFLLLFISAPLISRTGIASSRSPSQLAFGRVRQGGWAEDDWGCSRMFKNGLAVTGQGWSRIVDDGCGAKFYPESIPSLITSLLTHFQDDWPVTLENSSNVPNFAHR